MVIHTFCHLSARIILDKTVTRLSHVPLKKKYFICVTIKVFIRLYDDAWLSSVITRYESTAF